MPPSNRANVRTVANSEGAALPSSERRLAHWKANPTAPTANDTSPALLLAYAGLRSQEALQLDWRHVNLRTRTLTIDRTKSGRARVVPMHPRVDAMLFGMWHAAGKPARGPVFLSARGRPYADTRGLGGNPLKNAHKEACRRAGVTQFRLHDWRHDLAARFLIEGADVRSLMQIMGWSSPRMVQRYVTYRAEHLAAVLARVA
jgi:integrase